MVRRITVVPLLLVMLSCVHAQQAGLGGVGGAGGISGFQSNNARLVITTNNLADAPANAAYSQTITAVNGVTPFTWTVMLGSLPPGLALNSATGVIAGTPTTVGNYSFTVLLTDSTTPTAQTATKDLSIAVTCPPLQVISQSPLPGGTQGSAYNFQFQSIGGLGSVTWTNPGGGIPSGTTLSSGGLLSGTLTTAGNYNFTIVATDSCPTPQSDSHPFTMQVNNTLRITTTSPLPNGTEGVPYSTQMSASGGTPAYTWSILSGTLPAGLSLSTTGLISGTPTTASTATVSIQVMDSLGVKNNGQFTITTACTPLSITSGATLPNATQGQTYSTQLQSSGGTGTVTWSLIGGTLDPGLTLSSGGLISGTPTSPATYSPVIQAQDSCSPTPQTQSQTFSLTVFSQLTITTSSLPAGVQSVPYGAQVAVQGGVPPYVWTVPSGPVPTGAVDVVNDYLLMKLPDRNSFHMSGGSNPHYSALAGGLIEEIKGSSGNPWDLWWYDDKYVYFAFTENNDSSQQAACIAAGYPSCFVDPFASKAPQQVTIFIPRYMVPGQVYTFMTPTTLQSGNVNPMTRTTNCGADNQPPVYLGNRKVVSTISLVPTNWGGSVGSVLTLEADFYYSGNSSGVYGSRERFYYALGFGRVKWDLATWNGTSYVISSNPPPSTNVNKVAGGAPTLNFACKVPNENTTPVPNLAGILPTGTTLSSAPSLNIKDSTGAISGTPNSARTFAFNVQVEDSAGTITQKQLSITTTCPTLAFTSTSPLPQGTVSQAYSFQFVAAGGALPRTWQIIAGTLPAGLSLNQGTGLLNGTPTATGTFNFTVQVLDSCNPQHQSVQKPFTLAIAANSGALTITTTSPLPQGTEKQGYSQQLQATGGTPPYVWSVQSGTLPPGLTQNAAGLISGTPTTTGVSTWTAKVTDAILGTATKSLSLTIVCPVLAITSTSPLPPATVGQTYSFQFSSSGGITPITWTATGVPAGLSLSTSGLLSGTPTAAATSTLNVTATDSCSPTPQTTSGSFSLTVNPATTPVTITSTSPLAGATEGKPYNNQLTASGGTPPYTWSITASTLPPGLSLSTAGLISGTPTSATTTTPTFKATDSLGANDSKVLSITVSCPAFSVTSTSPLPTATQNQPYSFQFTSTGGILPIAWSGTSIPAGLTLSAGGLLSGTPTGSGTSTLNVTATDSCAPTPQVVGPTGYSLTINPATVPLQITTPSPLPPGTINQPYSTTLAATGGTPPYSAWTVTSGALPTGLLLNSTTGVISGTPTVLQTTTPTIRVSDNVAATASKVFSITINPASTADNRYCNTNETTNFTNPTDGPATLPTRCVRTAVADTPASGPTKTVCGSGCDFTTIQAALNAASAGWIIQVKATTGGAQNVFGGWSWPASASGMATNWIILETDQIANLPNEGTRISPAFYGSPSLVGRPTYTQPTVPGVYMPKIRGGNNLVPFATGVHHVRVIGLEFTTTAGTAVTGGIITLNTDDHVIFDRIACHGGDQPQGQSRDEISRCINFSRSTYVGVVDSYLYDTHCTGNFCVDSQAILAGGISSSVEGPFKIVDDFIETASEGTLSGGGGAGINSTTPNDIEIRRNHFFKPLFWKQNDPSYFGTSFKVKNNLELKNVNRVLIEGNILDTVWNAQPVSDQIGFQMLFTPKNQSNAFGGSASSDGAGTITRISGGAFNSNQTAANCAVPFHCKFKYNGSSFNVQTVIDADHLTLTTAAPASSSASYTAFTPGLNPNALDSNVTSRYNRITHSAMGYQIGVGLSDGGDVSKGAFNISIHDDIVDDVDGPHWSIASGACCTWGDIFQFSNQNTVAQGSLHDISVNHITALARSSGSLGTGPGVGFGFTTSAKITNFSITNSIFAAGFVWPGKNPCSTSTDATTVLNCFAPASYCFDHNALAVSTATSGSTTGTVNNPPYPSSPSCPFSVSGNSLPATYNAIQFTNLNGAIGGNYLLLPTSPYHNLASDGRDLGADVSLVNQAISGVN